MGEHRLEVTRNETVVVVGEDLGEAMETGTGIAYGEPHVGTRIEREQAGNDLAGPEPMMATWTCLDRCGWRLLRRGGWTGYGMGQQLH